jgi:endonuclease/exonuclease/phosphatase family metal-dependent hydrolase
MPIEIRRKGAVMGTIKIVSWNVEHLDRLAQGNLSGNQKRRRDAVVQEIQALAPDILCVLEGPKGEAGIERVATDLLAGEWAAVKASDGQYATLGSQWIWFLVRKDLAPRASLLPVAAWDAFTSKSWPCHLWGEFTEQQHQHYRHPQVLVLDWNGFRVEFIGLHLKSKFVNSGEKMWNAGGAEQETFIREALSARIKLTTEATNVRAYIDAKFRQVEKPAIIVLGDFNDGPGKEYFEERYLFFDLVSNLQGDVFFATRFLNHALFDFPDDLRWTVNFKDFVDPTRDPHILLDHILFTQGLVDGTLPWKIDAHAGKVEHEIHDLTNAGLPSSGKTSDHKPVSLIVTTAG